MKVERGDLKYNFLRRIILRLDYNGVFDVKGSIKEIEKILFNHNFNELLFGFIEQDTFDINDPIFIENELNFNLDEIENLETFKFKTADKNIILEINNLFTIMTVNATKSYLKFEEYETIFINVINIIRRDNLFLKPLRLGLRKINNCILLKPYKLGSYFNRNFISNVSKKVCINNHITSLTNSQMLDTLSIDNYYFNYARVVTDALVSKQNAEQNAFQVTLDIEGYDNNKLNLEKIIADKMKLDYELKEINSIIFELYANTLADTFINRLKNEGEKWNDILGVISNDNHQTES